jgi:hypothetical protein
MGQSQYHPPVQASIFENIVVRLTSQWEPFSAPSALGSNPATTCLRRSAWRIRSERLPASSVGGKHHPRGLRPRPEAGSEGCQGIDEPPPTQITWRAASGEETQTTARAVASRASCTFT